MAELQTVTLESYLADHQATAGFEADIEQEWRHITQAQIRKGSQRCQIEPVGMGNSCATLQQNATVGGSKQRVIHNASSHGQPDTLINMTARGILPVSYTLN